MLVAAKYLSKLLGFWNMDFVFVRKCFVRNNLTLKSLKHKGGALRLKNLGAQLPLERCRSRNPKTIKLSKIQLKNAALIAKYFLY